MPPIILAGCFLRGGLRDYEPEVPDQHCRISVVDGKREPRVTCFQTANRNVFLVGLPLAEEKGEERVGQCG